VIVAEETEFHKTSATLEKVNYGPDIYGRISTHININEYTALADISRMKPVLYAAEIDEVIFCVNGLSFKQILEQMENCGPSYEYKIHLPGSQSFVGSNSSQTSGDLYTIDRRFNLSKFSQLRNKRMIDLTFSLLGILLFPILIFIVKKPGKFFLNCIAILSAKKSWVGYDKADTEQAYLPKLKTAVLPPYNIVSGFNPGTELRHHMNILYAQHYYATQDINLILKNIKFLGR
jgi:O-antigen biosynthesis protein